MKKEEKLQETKGITFSIHIDHNEVDLFREALKSVPTEPIREDKDDKGINFWFNVYFATQVFYLGTCHGRNQMDKIVKENQPIYTTP